METISFTLLVAGTLAIFILGLLKPTGYLQLPFLSAAVFLGWVIPQVWAVRQRFAGTVEDANLTILHLFLLGCLVATVAGWQWGTVTNSGARIPERLKQANLKSICLVVTLISWAMAVGIGSAAFEERASSTWSGPLTIMYFVFNLKILSLTLSTYLVLKRPSPIVIALFVANLALYLPTAFLYFRRRAMLELFLAGCLGFWFARRAVLPRLVVFSALPVGTLVVFAIAALRQLADVASGNARWVKLSDLGSIDFWAATPFANQQNAPELTNAFNIIRLIDWGESFTYGATSWNRIVFQWIPAQLLGADFKRSLMFDIDTASNIEQVFDEVHRVGATPSGMGESYLEFGFFGVIFFVLTGFVCGRWWARAHRGSYTSMMLYVAGLSAAIMMPTSYAIYFFNSMALQVAAVALLAFAFASRKSLLRPELARSSVQSRMKMRVRQR